MAPLCKGSWREAPEGLPLTVCDPIFFRRKRCRAAKRTLMVPSVRSWVRSHRPRGLRIPRLRLKPKSRSLRRSSSPHKALWLCGDPACPLTLMSEGMLPGSSHRKKDIILHLVIPDSGTQICDPGTSERRCGPQIIQLPLRGGECAPGRRLFYGGQGSRSVFHGPG